MSKSTWNNLTGKTITLHLGNDQTQELPPAGTPPTIKWAGGKEVIEEDDTEVQLELRPVDIAGFPLREGKHILPQEVVVAARELGCRSSGQVYAWDATSDTLIRCFGWPGAGSLEEEDSDLDEEVAAA